MTITASTRTVATENDVIIAVGQGMSDSDVLTVYDLDAVYASGSPIPSDIKDMVGGTFTGAGVYTAPTPSTIDYDERDSKWAEARTDYVENGMADDIKWKRCVIGGHKGCLEDADWDLLVAEYTV